MSACMCLFASAQASWLAWASIMIDILLVSIDGLYWIATYIRH